jgi:hypothetical protein
MHTLLFLLSTVSALFVISLLFWLVCLVGELLYTHQDHAVQAVAARATGTLLAVTVTSSIVVSILALLQHTVI